MDFELSERARELQARLTDFMAAHVLPAEPVYERQLAEAGDPHHHPAVMEELKATARDAGLWNLFHPDER
jgi:acyl-CoA dehydrogenase